MSRTLEQRAVRQLHHDAGDRPMITIWEVTRACALVCRHCRADAQHRRNPFELSTDEGKALLDDIAGWGKPYPIVVLGGTLTCAGVIARTFVEGSSTWSVYNISPHELC